MTIYVKDLAEVISTKCNVAVKAHAQEAVTALFEKIIEQVNTGNKVFITGFGEFSFLEKKARKARNPKTGESIDVAAYKKLEFTPVKEFRKIR